MKRHIIYKPGYNGERLAALTDEDFAELQRMYAFVLLQRDKAVNGVNYCHWQAVGIVRQKRVLA